MRLPLALEAMHVMQDVRTITRSLAGTIVLGAALTTHIPLGLYKLTNRNTLRMPPWKGLQILIALAIPFLSPYNTRIAHAVFGVTDSEPVRVGPPLAGLGSDPEPAGQLIADLIVKRTQPLDGRLRAIPQTGEGGRHSVE